MTSIECVTLEVDDLPAAGKFYDNAIGLTTQLRLRASETATTGFRGFTLSLTVAQPATARGFLDAALDAGATSLKPAAKSFWGFGGVVQAPDGAIWKIATSAKKDTGPGPVKLALYGRKALAKDAGVAPEGSGSHRLAVGSPAGPFTDPDGFAWEAL